MAKITVYKYRENKEKGVFRTLKDGVDFDEYVKRHTEKGIHICKTSRPSLNMMEKWIDNGVACAIDGCRVECDGVCEHGFPSKMLAMGLI